MKCLSVNSFLREDGFVFNHIQLEGGNHRNLPYCQEHKALIGKDIQSEEDFNPIVRMPLAMCPYCGAILHQNDEGPWCMRVHCAGLRRTILLDQLTTLGILTPMEVLLKIDQGLSSDISFDLLMLFDIYANYKQRLRNLSLRQFLKILRVPTLNDDELDALFQIYPTPVRLARDVLEGTFLFREISISKSVKDSICLSIGYLNSQFVQKLLSN